jgi:D-alanyl-D-alanine carboxypeptidase
MRGFIGKTLTVALSTFLLSGNMAYTVETDVQESVIETENIQEESMKETLTDEIVNSDVELDIKSPSALLMESTTGEIIYAKGANERRSPASVTKIMTLLLIFDALKTGQISLTDEAVTTAHAKSMGGSQVFLEEGEKQTVETLIKCIVIASGNDAAVTMAEFISGSEEEFVKAMNERAASLEMTNTNFEDACGLTDSKNHYTTAYDIALMSRELIVEYPEIEQYAIIWMEDITHTTRQGSSTFTLSNTNKLLKSYDGITGLKTGYTSQAMFCISATARRNGIHLISVIMASSDSKTRNKDAATLLTYGFGKCSVYTDENTEILPDAFILNGVETQVPCEYEKEFHYLEMNGIPLTDITKEIVMNEEAVAPIAEGDIAGKAVYYLAGNEIGSVNILYKRSVEKAGFIDYLMKTVKRLCI